jgi:hypothetical protein
MKCEDNFDLGWSFQRLGWSLTLVRNEARLWSGMEFLFFSGKGFIFFSSWVYILSGTGFIFCLERSFGQEFLIVWNGVNLFFYICCRAWRRSSSASWRSRRDTMGTTSQPPSRQREPGQQTGTNTSRGAHKSPPSRESQGSKQVPTPAGELIKVLQAERARAANRYKHPQESS